MALHSLCANKRPRSRSQQGCCGSLSGDFPPLEYPPFLHHLRPSAELHAVGSYLPDLWRFVHGGMSHQSTVITLVVVVEVVVAALTENLPTALVESTQGENIGGTASRSNENRRSTLYFYQLRHVLQGLKGEASRCSGLCSEEAFSKGPAKEKDASKPESEEIPLVNAEEGISKEDESILPAMRAKERCFPRCMSPPLAVRVPLIATVFNSRVPILAASEPKTVAAYPGGFGGRLLRAPSLYLVETGILRVHPPGDAPHGATSREVGDSVRFLRSFGLLANLLARQLFRSAGPDAGSDLPRNVQASRCWVTERSTGPSNGRPLLTKACPSAR
eukprot:8004029-Pyramimonas_sp.AAC.1